MSSCLVVLTTVPSPKVARHLASVLLKKRIASCVNISSGWESHYWWKGKRERAREIMLVIKTRAPLYTDLEKTIRKNHPYTIPEIIAISIQKGSKDYLDWVIRETAQPRSR
ncbi:MAG: divalent-cation tolerance protein CutA [Candidatus Omnitrophica bacterium]|nr:divalent-cation tolerance protein CutA [Candidatus Omnitrophota bacterium]